MRQSFHVARLSARIDGVGLCSQIYTTPARKARGIGAIPGVPCGRGRRHLRARGRRDGGQEISNY